MPLRDVSRLLTFERVLSVLRQFRQHQVEGKPVETTDDLMDAMEKYKVGDRVKVDVMRGNKRQTVDVTLQAVN